MKKRTKISTKKLFNEYSIAKDMKDNESIRISSQAKFIINTIAYVPSDDELSDSDSEEGIIQDDPFTHENAVRTYLNNSKSPYRVVFDDFGDEVVSAVEILSYDGVKAKESKLAKTFLDKLHNEGFEEQDKDKLENLKVSIGLNRPRSLSEKKNKALINELKTNTSESTLAHTKIGFFWNYKWIDQTKKEAAYKTVKDFYKRLKKKNLNKAEEFRKTNEKVVALKELQNNKAEKQNGAFIPYQFLREYVKTHEETRNLISAFRKGDLDSVIYFSFVDSDTKNFNGVYSAYYRILNFSEQLPTVMSTGYEFEEKCFKVASKIDNKIRAATAKHFPAGVYYPEPNFCVLLPMQSNTLFESFINSDVGSPKGSCESAALLRQVIKRENSIFIFQEDKPLITTLPIRSKYNKLTKISFSEKFYSSGMPSINDLGLLMLINQSHYNMHNWLNNLYVNRSFEKYGGKHKTEIAAIYNYYLAKKESFGELDSSKNILKTERKINEDVIEKITLAAEGRSKVVLEFKKLVEEGGQLELEIFLDWQVDVLSNAKIQSLIENQKASLSEILDIYRYCRLDDGNRDFDDVIEKATVILEETDDKDIEFSNIVAFYKDEWVTVEKFLDSFDFSISFVFYIYWNTNDQHFNIIFSNEAYDYIQEHSFPQLSSEDLYGDFLSTYKYDIEGKISEVIGQAPH